MHLLSNFAGLLIRCYWLIASVWWETLLVGLGLLGGVRVIHRYTNNLAVLRSRDRLRDAAWVLVVLGLVGGLLMAPRPMRWAPLLLFYWWLVLLVGIGLLIGVAYINADADSPRTLRFRSGLKVVGWVVTGVAVYYGLLRLAVPIGIK